MKNRYLLPLTVALSGALLLGACAPAATATSFTPGAVETATQALSNPTSVPTSLPSETSAPPPTAAPTANIPATGSGTAMASTPASEQTPGTPAGPVTIGDNTVITLADDGATVTMQTGQRFLVQLGEDYDWAVTPADQSVLSRVIGITVIRGAQGIYEAHQAGTTTLSAEGTPVCTTKKPGCTPTYQTREFKVTVMVK